MTILLNLFQTENPPKKVRRDPKEIKGSWKKRIQIKKSKSGFDKKRTKLEYLQDRPFNTAKSNDKKADLVEPKERSANAEKSDLVKAKERGNAEKANTVKADTGNTNTERADPKTKKRVFDKSKNISNEKTEIKAPISTSFGKKYIAPKVINVEDKVFNQKVTFREVGISEQICKHLETKMAISVPTVIQSVAIPAILSEKDRDVSIQSITGSGKSLSFLLPVIQTIFEKFSEGESVTNLRQSGTIAIVLSPTRELAQQLYSLLEKILNTNYKVGETMCTLVPGIIVGGDKRKSEKARLRKGIHILVATPGRLLDHLENTEAFKVDQLRFLVLDEADRLLDLGFGEKLNKIISLIKTKGCQAYRTIMCSATLQNRVESLSQNILDSPLIIRSTQSAKADDFETPKHLIQKFVVCPPKFRLLSLIAFLRSKMADLAQNHGLKIIIFVSCCSSVNFHHAMLSLIDNDSTDKVDTDGIVAESKSEICLGAKMFKLHGSMTQLDRSKVFEGFSSCKRGVLVCTDVAARGLDLPQVNYIVQYEPPCDIKDYVHRVGRTARLDQKGEALLFLLPSEKDYVEMLRNKKIVISELDLEHILVSLTNDDDSYKQYAVELQYRIENLVSSRMKEVARKAYRSTLRAYSSHPSSEKAIFNLKLVHIGHLAKSFGLNETPKQIAKGKDNETFESGKEETFKRPLFRESTKPTKKQKMMKSSLDASSEFASGI